MVSRKIRGREIKKNERKKNDFVFFSFFGRDFAFRYESFHGILIEMNDFLKKGVLIPFFVTKKKDENFIFKNLDIKKNFRSMGTIFIKFFF